MKKAITLLSILLSLKTASQGALMVGRFSETPENQWFMFYGRRHSGVFVYNGSPVSVENELRRTLERYKISHDSLNLTGHETDLEYIVNKKYNMTIKLSESDTLLWSRSMYLIIR